MHMPIRWGHENPLTMVAPEHHITMPVIPAAVGVLSFVVGMLIGVMVGHKKCMVHEGMMGMKGAWGGGWGGGRHKGKGKRDKSHHHHGEGSPPCDCDLILIAEEDFSGYGGMGEEMSGGMGGMSGGMGGTSGGMGGSTGGQTSGGMGTSTGAEGTGMGAGGGMSSGMEE